MRVDSSPSPKQASTVLVGNKRTMSDDPVQTGHTHNRDGFIRGIVLCRRTTQFSRREHTMTVEVISTRRRRRQSAAINRQQLVLRSMDVEKLVDEGHCVRAIWALAGRLDLRRYHEQIAAVEGIGREHTDPQLLISLWLYAYSRGISSPRELARQCE
jgi:hypothetical protein